MSVLHLPARVGTERLLRQLLAVDRAIQMRHQSQNFSAKLWRRRSHALRSSRSVGGRWTWMRCDARAIQAADCARSATSSWMVSGAQFCGRWISVSKWFNWTCAADSTAYHEILFRYQFPVDRISLSIVPTEDLSVQYQFSIDRIFAFCSSFQH